MKQRILHILLGILIGALGGALAGYWVGLNHGAEKKIPTYEECVAAGYPVQESSPQRCATPDGKSFTQTQPDKGQALTLEGNVICLPHKDAGDIHTLECAIGLKTTDGKYYNLEFDTADTSLSGLTGSDRKVKITGTLKPTADNRYQSEGIIVVTNYEFI